MDWLDKLTLGVILLILAALLLGGCATTPPDTRLNMTCAIVAHGEARFENDPRRFPSMKLVCDRIE